MSREKKVWEIPGKLIILEFGNCVRMRLFPSPSLPTARGRRVLGVWADRAHENSPQAAKRREKRVKLSQRL